MSKPTLTFGYSTLSTRLENIQLPDLATNSNWDVLVTVQSGTDLPPTVEQLLHSPMGDRVTTKAFSGRGVTLLRNQVIQHASGKYLIFADDDIVFNERGLIEALNYLETNQDVALLLGQAEDENGNLRKSYPKTISRLTKLNSAKAATYEMIVRVSAIRDSGVLFDERFGAGAETTYLGDEYIFIADLVSAKLRCDFVPMVLAVHPKDSSGSGWGTSRDRKARALIFDRVFRGNRSLPYLARIAFGLRKLGRGLNLIQFISFVFKH
jgi:glycosyltransferase involved in cell wall biosynthesis